MSTDLEQRRKIRTPLIFVGASVFLGAAFALAAHELVQADESPLTEAQIEDLREDIAVVEEEIAQSDDQQSGERNEAMAKLPPLPKNAEYIDIEELGELEEQRSALRSSTPDLDPEDLEVTYEDGYFESNIALGWQCSWLSEAVRLADHGDLDGANAAVDMLWKFTDTELIENFPDYDLMITELGEPIRTGDVANAKSYLPENCTPETLVN